MMLLLIVSSMATYSKNIKKIDFIEYVKKSDDEKYSLLLTYRKNQLKISLDEFKKKSEHEKYLLLEKYIETPSKITLEDFKKKGDFEKYIILQITVSETIKYRNLFTSQLEISKLAFKGLEAKSKKFGISFSAGYDLSMKSNSEIFNTFNFYNDYYIFLSKYIFIIPGLKIDMNYKLFDTSVFWGGGIKFGFGVMF